ncbi:hypothetical protein O3P69_003990 [Scylla paramamosain]|uniref:Pro-resilin n=1 Tax=Scylla paramamosain TaxID=85552 RepID=A0AAW0UI67_SCYPA
MASVFLPSRSLRGKECRDELRNDRLRHCSQPQQPAPNNPPQPYFSPFFASNNPGRWICNTMKQALSNVACRLAMLLVKEGAVVALLVVGAAVAHPEGGAGGGVFRSGGGGSGGRGLIILETTEGGGDYDGGTDVDYGGDGVRLSPYTYNYGVQAGPRNFGQKEEGDGKNAKGYYYVALPDGRLQMVSYVADSSGYHPSVSYYPAAASSSSSSSSSGYDY